MRVTIEHREAASGKQRDYFVDCTVELSEEEKAIVKARGLHQHHFTVPLGTPPPTLPAIFGIAAMRGLGVLLMIAGFVLSFFRRTQDLGSLMVLVGIGMGIYGWLRGRTLDRQTEATNQTISIGRLITSPSFSVHAIDPGHAKAADEDIRGKLVAMKELIAGSADLGKKQTFEL